MMHTLGSSAVDLKTAKGLIVNGKREGGAAGPKLEGKALEEYATTVAQVLYIATAVCGLRLVGQDDLAALDALRTGVQGVLPDKGYGGT
jgi:hypothetical protein